MRHPKFKMLLVSMLFAVALPILDGSAQSLQFGEIEDYRENADDDPETRLVKEKIRAAFTEVAIKTERFRTGEQSVQSLWDPQQRLTAALLEFHQEPARIVELLEKQVTLWKFVEQGSKERMEAGVARPDDLWQATYCSPTPSCSFYAPARNSKATPKNRLHFWCPAADVSGPEKQPIPVSGTRHSRRPCPVDGSCSRRQWS